MTQTFKERLNSIRKTHSYRVEKAKLEFVRGISRAMEHKGINNAVLARKIESSPSYVTKVMRGDCNFTVDSMVKIAHALGGSLHIHVADSRADVRWVEAFDCAQIADNDASEEYRKITQTKQKVINPAKHLEERNDESGKLCA